MENPEVDETTYHMLYTRPIPLDKDLNICNDKVPEYYCYISQEGVHIVKCHKAK